MTSDASEELPQFVELILGESSLTYIIGGTVWYKHAEWTVEEFWPKERVILKRRDP